MYVVLLSMKYLSIVTDRSSNVKHSTVLEGLSRHCGPIHDETPPT